MKKILLLLFLFISASIFGQAEYEKIMLTENVKDSLALKLNVQSTSDEINFVLISELFSNISVDTIQFNSGEAVTWNENFKTINIPTGLGPILQTGQEFYFIVFNNTGVLIPNGAVIDPTAAILVGSEVIPTVELAKADTFETCSGTLFIATADIPIGGLGVGTLIGRVGGLDTSGFSPGDNIYLSATTAGEITNVMPEFPNYSIQIGGVIKSDALEGEIGVNFTDDVRDTFTNAWDGSFRETLDFTVSSDGVNVIGTLERFGGGDLTEVFSDGFQTLDCTPALTVNLTEGTDTNPQINYVYLSKSTGLITVSTSEFPTDEHIRISDLLIQSATKVQADGDLFNRNHNDHVKTVADNGHLLHIVDRMRQNPAAWDTGVLGSSSVVGASNSDVFINNTSGFVYQLHRQAFSSHDTSVSDNVDIPNHFATPFTTVSNLNGQNLDALGVSLANQSFSFVLWGVQNKTGEQSHLMINLPTGSYAKNSPDLAVSDPSNLSVYTIPRDFTGKGFLIARFTYTLSANGLDWTLFDTQDLRGFIPNSSAGGGGGGGSGITEFTGLLDTPNSYASQGSKIVAVSSGETALEFVDNVPFTDAANVYTLIQSNSTVPTLDQHLTNKLYVDSTINLNSKNYSWGESFVTNWRDMVLDDGATYFPNSGGYEIGRLHQVDANPSFHLIPSAVKVDSLYIIKGAPNFTVDRASSATYTDENGLISTAISEVPRVDYTDLDEVVLMEPQSTNLYLNNAVMVTQDITTAADDYTVTFFGTGTITFTGTFSGSLVGTGENDRVSSTFTATAGTLTSTISGTVTNGQAENLEHATSVIFTAGATVTRLADEINSAGTVDDFNSVEGVLFIELASLSLNNTNRFITISDGTSSNIVQVRYTDASNNIGFVLKVGGVTQVIITSSLSDLNFHEVAIKWKLNDMTLYVDGVDVGTDNTASTFAPDILDDLSFDDGTGSNDFYGKIKQLKVYKSIAESQKDLPYITNFLPLLLVFRRKRNDYKLAA